MKSTPTEGSSIRGKCTPEWNEAKAEAEQFQTPARYDHADLENADDVAVCGLAM